MDIRRNADVLAETLDFNGKRVLDIGCGDGALVRLAAKRGARATGVDVSRAQLERARTAGTVADEDYHEAAAQDLPFEDAAFDIVIFFNSLHHVAVEAMDLALKETARVLKPGGRLYVSEPLAEGSHFQIQKPAHDETVVRAAAYEALGRADALGFQADAEFRHINPIRYANFERFRDRMQAINPHIADTMEVLEPKLRRLFEDLGTVGEDGVEFEQPMRVNLYTRKTV
ncbi:MAG: class I SAM-dependent methyltransferase [Hyphomicrobiales bacterium]|nr:class I SAM-dependent methyltransferase [Hyphomicrobiales bacterium]MCP5370894.1 class I SAM-dependent methyltransferase [Hyphomicrobiales bacterium]